MNKHDYEKKKSSHRQIFEMKPNQENSIDILD